MDTIVQCAKCWLFLSTLRIIFAASDQAENCIQLESGELGPKKNWSEIKENNYINLTAHLQDTPGCERNNLNVFHMKISYQQINKTVDICKFILQTVCEVSDSSNATSNCKCLNNRTVQFLKKASSAGSKLYTWRWRHGKTPEKQRDILITVTKGNTTTDNPSDPSSAATASTVLFVLLLVVVAPTAGVVLWMRHKAKCSIEVKYCSGCYHSSGSDPSKDNQVNDQALSHGVDTYYTAVKDDVNTRFSNVKDHDTRQCYDPSYHDVEEQDTRQPLNSSYYQINTEQTLYAYVKKKDKTQPRDHTDASVKGQDSQPLDPYYIEVEEPATNHSDDPNHINGKEHDESQHYHLNYVDINKHDTCQQLHLTYSDINEQLSSQNYDPNNLYIKQQDTSQQTEASCYEIGTENKADEPPNVYVEKQDESQPLDPTNPDSKKQYCDPRYAAVMNKADDTCAHVKMQMNSNPGSSTNLHMKIEDTNHPDDLIYSDVKRHDANLAVDPPYPQVTGQDTRQERDPAYTLINKHSPAQPGHPIYVPDKEDTQQQVDFVYNHLHEDICQHDDPNYAQVEKKPTRKVGGLTFQDVREDKNLRCHKVKIKRTQASQTTSSTTSDNRKLPNQLSSPPRPLLLSL